MTKPPTAEEVLGLYREYQDAEQLLRELDEVTEDDMLDGNVDEEKYYDFCEALEKRAEKLVAFSESYEMYAMSQGPVTREWFEERFSSCVIMCRNGVIYDPRDDGTVVMEVEDSYGQVTVDLVNPTRERIEALVEMLGGTQ